MDGEVGCGWWWGWQLLCVLRRRGREHLQRRRLKGVRGHRRRGCGGPAAIGGSVALRGEWGRVLRRGGVVMVGDVSEVVERM